MGLTTAKKLILFGGPAYSAEAKALFAAMTTPPTAARKTLINNTIVALKNAGIWSRFDILYFAAAADSQAARLNWKSPGTFDLVAVNSPAFEVDRGFTGNGTSSRLRTQYTPSTNGQNYTQNSASAWVWSLTDAAVDTVELGNTTAPRLSIVTRSSAGEIAARINDNTSSTNSIASSVGLTGAQRITSATKRTFKNGVQQGTDSAIASTGLPTQEQWVCGGNSTVFSAKQIAFAGWADSLSGLELQLNNIALSYMQGVGAA